MVSTPERSTNNSPRTPMKPAPSNKTSARELLCLFTNILDVKEKSSIRRFRAAKSKRQAIKVGTTPWEM